MAGRYHNEDNKVYGEIMTQEYHSGENYVYVNNEKGRINFMIQHNLPYSQHDINLPPQIYTKAPSLAVTNPSSIVFKPKVFMLFIFMRKIERIVEKKIHNQFHQGGCKQKFRIVKRTAINEQNQNEQIFASSETGLHRDQSRRNQLYVLHGQCISQ